MDEPPHTTRRFRVDPGLAVTLVVAGVVVLAGVLASARGWIPTGDDAFLSLRTRHVISSDPILLNNASSGGPSAGTRYNHPGAFPLTLMSPVTLIGGPGSLALATALVNAAWIVGISLMVRRIVGRGGQMLALGAMALLVASMTSTLLVDPWNPNYGIWPLAAAIVATWGVRRYHDELLWVVVLASSVAFQTHLSYVVPAGVLALWALWPVVRRWRELRRSLLVAAAVGAVANAQMLADQAFGTGNLLKILRGSGFDEATVSPYQVMAVLASKTSIGPESWDHPVLLDEVPPWGQTVLNLGLLAAVVAACVVWLRRRERWNALSLLAVLAVAALPSMVVATRFPLRIGIPLPYFRWVWPIVVILYAVIAAVAYGRYGSVFRSRRREWAVAGHVAVVAFALLAFLPGDRPNSPNPAWAQDITAEFAPAAVDATRGRGPVLVQQSIQEAALWVIPGLMDQLDAAGIDVRATDEVLVQQTSESYRATGDERWQLLLRNPELGAELPEGARRLASVDPLSSAERAEWQRLDGRLRQRVLAPGAIVVTEVGRGETDADVLAGFASGEIDPVMSVPFQQALERGAVEVRDVDELAVRRWADLGARLGGRRVALYLAPLP